jgi:ADP-ribose pyrophosphatase
LAGGGVRDEQTIMNLSEPTKTVLFAGRFLTLAREGHWEYVERVNATGAAIILAVTDEGKLLLVEQYRIPCHARTIELPAGIIGDEPKFGAESQAEAARRELLEETGYAAEQIEALTTGPASSGVTSELVTLFRASRLKRTGDGGGVGLENIVVHEVLLSQVHQWLEEKARAGVLVDSKIYAGLYFLSAGAPGRSGTDASQLRA